MGVPENVTPKTSELKTRIESSGKRLECSPEDAVHSNALGAFSSKKGELSIEKGCLLWGHRTVIPEPLKRDILQLLHSTHSGMSAMKKIARNYVWWPRIDADIETMVKMCQSCAQNQNMPPKAHPHPWIRSTAPWERLHMDYAGPFKGSMWLLVVDSFSKWIEVYNMRNNCTAPNTIRKLQILFNRFGLPKTLVSDNAPQLVKSSEFEAFCNANGISHVPIPSYHPASNGQAEAIVGKFKKAMKKMAVSSTDLEMNLTSWLFNYHNTPHTSTKVEPAVLMTGRRFRSQLSLLNPLSCAENSRVKEESARVESESSLRRFQIGDSVLFRNVLHGKWERGVVKAISDKIYEIESEGHVVRKHIDHVVASAEQREASPEPVHPSKEEVLPKPDVGETPEMIQNSESHCLAPATQPNEAASTSLAESSTPNARPKRMVNRPDRLNYDKLGGH